MAVALLALNVSGMTRLSRAPNLRENFAVPFMVCVVCVAHNAGLSLMFCYAVASGDIIATFLFQFFSFSNEYGGQFALAVNLIQRGVENATLSSRSTRWLFGVTTLAFILTWQFAPFVLLLQVCFAAP
jgi:hypothetical protein